MSRAAALALCLLVAACASRGDLAPQGRLRDARSLASDASFGGAASPWPSADWWRQFADPQLDQLVSEALRDSPDLEAADARARQAAAQAGLVDAARQPTLNARAGVSGSRLPESLFGDSIGGHFSTSENAILSLAVPFDLWGGKRAAWEAAVGSQRAAEIDRQASRLTVSSDVARAYVRLGYAFQAREIASSDLERARRLHGLTRQRVTAGLDSQAQLRQAESAMASAEQKLEQASMNVASSRIALAVLLGKGPDRGLELSRPALMKPAQLSVPDNLPANLLGRRPDIVAARWRVESTRRSIDSARTDFYPNLNLSVYAGLASKGLGGLLKSGSVLALVSPAISLPVFDGGRLRANLAGRDADHDLAIAHYNKTLVTAFNQVADQMQTIRSLGLQADSQAQAVAAARQAWDLATLRYQRGVGSYLEALTVQQALLAAESVLANLQNQQLDASIQLVQALGGGFDESANAAQRTGNSGNSDNVGKDNS